MAFTAAVPADDTTSIPIEAGVVLTRRFGPGVIVSVRRAGDADVEGAVEVWER